MIRLTRRFKNCSAIFKIKSSKNKAKRTELEFPSGIHFLNTKRAINRPFCFLIYTLCSILCALTSTEQYSPHGASAGTCPPDERHPPRKPHPVKLNHALA
jgi:hypothetical protein